MTTKLLSVMTGAAVAALLIGGTSGAAVARGHSRFVHVQGAYGRGYTRSTQVNRGPGYASGTRSLQTNSGRGYTHSFDRSCSGGTCTASGSTVTNGGNAWSHQRSVSVPGNGTASYSASGTGPRGGSYARGGGCTEGYGCSHGGTYAGPNGNVWTHNGSTTRNPDGSVSHTSHSSGPNGSGGGTWVTVP